MRIILVIFSMFVALLAAFGASTYYGTLHGWPLYPDPLSAEQESTAENIRWVVGLGTFFILGGLFMNWNERWHAKRGTKPRGILQLAIFVALAFAAAAIYRKVKG